MIKLYQYPPMMGVPNMSPFCMKMETYLRIADLEYKAISLSDPRKAPKGKLPFIEDNGTRIADSGLIIDYLKSAHDVDLDAALNPAERAESMAFGRLIEEHFYWAVVYSRWMDDGVWPATRKIFFGGMPRVIAPLATRMIRGQVRKSLHGHGIGRHSADEIFQMARDDLQALADFLGDKPYMMGETVSSLDATAYAFIANLLDADLDTPIRTAAQGHKNLVAYGERMKSAYYG